MYSFLQLENFKLEVIMRPQRPITKKAKVSLEDLLNKTKTKADFQRVQCVWLRAELGMDSTTVGKAVGWAPGTVKKVWSQYFSGGEAALIGVGRGGRRRNNLNEDEEQSVLAPFFEKASSGGVLVANEVKQAYEQTIGREVPKSTVYRMLARHGWRKIAPRPRHPKADKHRQEAFKKNCRK